MSIKNAIVVPIRSAIAGLIARHSPDFYRRMIESRHPGVQVVAAGTSDVQALKGDSLERVLHAVEAANCEILTTIDDRHSWILLVGVRESPDDGPLLVNTLLDAGLRVAVSIDGRRARYIKNEGRLKKLLKRTGGRITLIRAGLLWMRARGLRRIGWHAATRIHLYDRQESDAVARRAGNLPPRVAGGGNKAAGTACLSSPESRLDKIGFPIDIVYTWVDGDDPDWNAKRERVATAVGRELHRVANSQTRFVNRDELRYSLRSIYYFAPWIRKIYLVTDNQVPNWVNDDSDSLRVISHRELFPDLEQLPTFNSHAIESVLHRIPGLSEQFIYMNDDVFLSSVVNPESFFEVGGASRVFLSRSMIPFSDVNQSEIASEWGLFNANRLLEAAHGVTMPYKTKHTPIALQRPLLESLETRFAKEYARLRQSPFRTVNDIAPTTSLHASFGLAEGHVVRGSIAYRYVNLARPDLEQALTSIEHSRRAMVFCLNDTEIDNSEKFDWEHQENLVNGFLRRMYPYQAPWEKPDTESKLA